MRVSHFEFLVEEPSAEAFLRAYLPRFLASGVTFDVKPFQGKADLLAHLPSRLKGYAAWMPEDWRLVVLVDRDEEDCHQLKADTVRNYKRLAEAERVFRALKSLDIRIRPIRHRTENHVRAHILLCLLAYYVERHMRRALAPMLFDDEEREASRTTRDPVAPARPSASADAKRRSRQSTDGLEFHSFETLLVHPGTRCQNRCRLRATPGAPTALRLTEPTPLHEKALKRIGTVVPSP